MDMQCSNFTDFLSGYIACALQLASDEADESGGERIDCNYDRSDIAEDTMALIQAECLAFATLFESAIEAALDNKHGYTWSSAGYDFWLTRNGHGAGFWDRGLGTYYGYDIGKALSDASEIAGPRELYVGDDGYISQSGHVVRQPAMH